ncbi:MAG: molybdopterin converting factor subunit 1 [Chloroflexi bacterium]|nr:molybdopterin converting factor subunit 1 [Chloroflexota bacterium]
MAKLLYFASLRERLDCEQEQLDLPQEVVTVADLKSLLAVRDSRWNEAFSSDSRLLVSVNQQMANAQSAIKNDDEIAFFPPVTGG